MDFTMSSVPLASQSKVQLTSSEMNEKPLLSRTSTQGDFSDEESDDEIQDWSSLNTIKKVNKDLEPLVSIEDSSRLSLYDQNKLNNARNMKFNALSGKRGLIVNLKNIQQSIIYINIENLEDLFMINPKGKFLETMGDIDRDNKCQLTFEETIYLIERGSCLAKIWHSDPQKNEGYQNMPPLSLQLVYSILITNDRMSDQYMVYSILKRDGYIVSRHEEFNRTTSNTKREVIKPINIIGRNSQLNWYMRFLDKLTNFFSIRFPFQLTFSYLNVFKYLQSKVLKQSIPIKKSKEFKNEHFISYNVWKPTGTFKKKNKPLPDFQISIIKASQRLPGYDEILSLFERSQTNHNTQNIIGKRGKGNNTLQREWKYDRGINLMGLKQNNINITMAIVDNSVINFITLSHCSFAGEGPVWRDHWAHPTETKRKSNKSRVNMDDTTKLLKIDTIDKIKNSMPNRSRSTPNLQELRKKSSSPAK